MLVMQSYRGRAGASPDKCGCHVQQLLLAEGWYRLRLAEVWLLIRCRDNGGRQGICMAGEHHPTRLPRPGGVLQLQLLLCCLPTAAAGYGAGAQ